jgi:hypothetical protein
MGVAAVWAVPHEDLYDSPVYADDDDDCALSMGGLALAAWMPNAARGTC